MGNAHKIHKHTEHVKHIKRQLNFITINEKCES